jgi:hypothetical protein
LIKARPSSTTRCARFGSASPVRIALPCHGAQADDYGVIDLNRHGRAMLAVTRNAQLLKLHPTTINTQAITRE